MCVGALAPGWRGTVVKDDRVVDLEAVVERADVNVGRRRELLIHVEKQLLFARVQLHILGQPLHDPLHALRPLQCELLLLEYGRVAHRLE